MSRGDRARAAAYYRDFLPGMITYVLVVVLVGAVGHLDGTSPWRFAWALLPVVPTLLVVRAVVRHLRRVDEFARTQLLVAIGVGFAAAMTAAVGLGFLASAGAPFPAGTPSFGVLAAGMAAFGISAAVQNRR
ncbi:hypothetical protein ACFFKU_01060 [Kineococcus gynurae]